MKKYTVTFVLFLLELYIVACNSNSVHSPYESIYNLPELKTISDSIQKFPSDDKLYYRRYKILAHLNDQYLEAALYDLTEAWKLKKTLSYANELGFMISLKNRDSAISFLKNAIIRYPNNAEIKETLGDIYDNEKKYDEALKIFNETIAMEPDNPWYKRKKALVLDKMGKKAEAIAILKEDFDKGEKVLGDDLAFMLAQEKDPRAIEVCDKIIRNDSSRQRAEPYYFKGVYYYNINSKQKAIDEFDKAIKINFNFLDAYMEKGRTLYELNKTKDALKVFNLTTTVSPAFADGYFWIAKCQQALGQKTEARENYQRAYGFDKTLTEAKDSADKIK